MANAGENIEHFALPRQRVGNAVGRKQGQLQFSCDFDGGLIARFFVAAEMALKFDVNIVPAERTAKLLARISPRIRFRLAPERAPAGLPSPPVRQIRPPLIIAIFLQAERSLLPFSRGVSFA